jgi:hypothetical protein
MPRFIVPLCEKAGGCVAAPSHILLCCVVLRGTTFGYVDHLRALFLSLPLPLPLPSAVCLFNFANPPAMSSALYVFLSAVPSAFHPSLSLLAASDLRQRVPASTIHLDVDLAAHRI